MVRHKGNDPDKDARDDAFASPVGGEGNLRYGYRHPRPTRLSEDASWRSSRGRVTISIHMTRFQKSSVIHGDEQIYTETLDVVTRKVQSM
jgi:hypothetical protein